MNPFEIPKTERDWTEDFHLENGNYLNKCIQCNEMFAGHKRRNICKLCSNDFLKEVK